MPKWLSLRIRFALFFAALALGGSALLGAGLWFGYSRSGGPVDGYVIGWLVGSFGLCGLAAWIGLLFDENVARPIRGLASDLITRAKADVSVSIDQTGARYLGSIGPAAQAIYEALDEARTSQARALAEKTARLRRDKALLEGLVRDLAEGIVVMSPAGEILLYNQVAVDTLGPLGIDRPLSHFVGIDPIADAIGRLSHDQNLVTDSFLTSTPDGSVILTGAVSNVGTDEGLVGHVLIFHDTTEDLRTHGALDGVLTTLMDRARRPAMAIQAVLDVLDQGSDLPAETVAKFTASMRDEVGHLSTALATAEAAQEAMLDNHWPMRAVPLDEILQALRPAHGAIFSVDASDVTLRCDGFAIAKLWEKTLHALRLDPDRKGFRFSVTREGAMAQIELSWDGAPLRQTTLDAAIDDPISDAYGPYMGRDALKAHRSDLLIAPGARLLMPMPLAHTKPARPRGRDVDFYDFDSRPRGDTRALKDVTYVVFDTETTGLDAVKDEVVQIAGVRIVRDRCVRGEVFDSLVAPGRPIPAAAIEIHGVTNEMVADAPDFTHAGGAFARFADGAILVAHHAAFDMAFLKRLEAGGGPPFDHPVLCTARMSSKLDSHSTDHTLDALAERYGVTLDEAVRHTALGDAQATAEVFLKMVPVLAERGIHTLDDALAFQGLTTKA